MKPKINKLNKLIFKKERNKLLIHAVVWISLQKKIKKKKKDSELPLQGAWVQSPGWGAKILHAAWLSQKKKNKGV